MYVKLAYLGRCTAVPFQKMAELGHHASYILFTVMFVVPCGLHLFYHFVTFIDDFTSYTCIFALKSKSEVFTYFHHFSALAKTKTSLKIANMKTDKGGEYMSSIVL